MTRETDLLFDTADIVARLCERGDLAPSDLSPLIKQVHGTLIGLSDSAGEGKIQKPEPAVPINRSVSSTHVVCLVCGRKLQSLKRHIRAAHGMNADEYRAAFGLSSDYPLVSRNYSRARSELAKDIGLGVTRSGKKSVKQGARQRSRKRPA